MLSHMESELACMNCGLDACDGISCYDQPEDPEPRAIERIEERIGSVLRLTYRYDDGSEFVGETHFPEPAPVDDCDLPF